MASGDRKRYTNTSAGATDTRSEFAAIESADRLVGELAARGHDTEGVLLLRGRMELVGVHVGDEVAHVVEGGLVGLDDDAETLVERLQVVVGDHDGDLDEFIHREIETCHLAVDPHQEVGSSHIPSLSRHPDGRFAVGRDADAAQVSVHLTWTVEQTSWP